MRTQAKVMAIGLMLTFLFLAACKNFQDINEVESIAWDAEFAIPLAYATLTLEDFLGDEDNQSFLEIDPEGNMTLAYSADATHNTAEELLGEIPSFPIVLIDTVMNIPVQIFPNLEVTQFNLKEGTISFDLQSLHEEDLDVTITIPNMTKNGTPFTTNVTLSYQGTLPVTASISPVSLQDYSLSMIENNMQIQYEAKTNLGEKVVLNAITGEAANWNYEMVKGVWAQETFSVKSDTLDLDIYDNWLEGEISFEDPKLIINVENSFGFAAGISLKYMTAFTADGNQIELTATDNAFNIAYPAINEIGEMKTTSFVFDKNNSNIKDIFNALPTMLVYEIEGILNPEDTNDQGFITDQSTVGTSLEVEMPVYGTASGFTIESTSELELDDFEDIADAEFKLIADNGIPLDVDLQVYFLDEYDTRLDSLFEIPQTILGAAAVDGNGEVTNTEEVISIIDVPKDRMQVIQNAKNMRIEAAISTFNDGNTPVLIKSNYAVNARIGAKIGMEE